MIKAENLVKSYNGKDIVLNDISLDIAEGEFVVILGASGSGKSTLMNVLSGLERADSGKVNCCGYELSEMNDAELTKFRRDNIAFIFQQYYLLPHLSVENNVRLGADLVGNKSYGEIIKAVGLEDKCKVKPSVLSGGEQQRVCIARALAKKPKILFLDEPTGALDEKTGRHVLEYIMKMRRDTGLTMVMVTHNANIAEMAETVINMNSGKIVGIQKNTNVKTAMEIAW